MSFQYYNKWTSCWACGRIWRIPPKYCCGRLTPKEKDLLAKNMCPVDSQKPPLQCNGVRLFANINIGNEMIAATVDTSSPTSYISEALVRKIAQKCRNGQISFLKNTVRLNVRLGTSSGEFQFVCKPKVVHDVVLGLDFLSRIGTTLICGANTLKLETAPPVNGLDRNINVKPEVNEKNNAKPEVNRPEREECVERRKRPADNTETVTLPSAHIKTEPSAAAPIAATSHSSEVLVPQEEVHIPQQDVDPLAGVNVSAYNDEAVAELRDLVRNANKTRQPGAQKRLVEIVHGKRIGIKICKDGAVHIWTMHEPNKEALKLKQESLPTTPDSPTIEQPCVPTAQTSEPAPEASTSSTVLQPMSPKPEPTSPSKSRPPSPEIVRTPPIRIDLNKSKPVGFQNLPNSSKSSDELLPPTKKPPPQNAAPKKPTEPNLLTVDLSKYDAKTKGKIHRAVQEMNKTRLPGTETTLKILLDDIWQRLIMDQNGMVLMKPVGEPQIARPNNNLSDYDAETQSELLALIKEIRKNRRYDSQIQTRVTIKGQRIKIGIRKNGNVFFKTIGKFGESSQERTTTTTPTTTAVPPSPISPLVTSYTVPFQQSSWVEPDQMWEEEDPLADVDTSAFDCETVNQLRYFVRDAKNSRMPDRCITVYPEIGNQKIQIMINRVGLVTLTAVRMNNHNLADLYASTSQQPPETFEPYLPISPLVTTYPIPFENASFSTESSSFIPTYPPSQDPHSFPMSSYDNSMPEPEYFHPTNMASQFGPECDPLTGVDISAFDEYTVAALRRLVGKMKRTDRRQAKRQIRGQIFLIQINRVGLVTVTYAEDDPLAGVDVSAYDDETVIELRNTIRDAKRLRWQHIRIGFVQLIRGNRIHIKVNHNGRVFLTNIFSNEKDNELASPITAQPSNISPRLMSEPPAPKRVRLTPESTAAPLSRVTPKPQDLIPEVDFCLIDLSIFSDETIAELRIRIRRIKSAFILGGRRKFEEIVRGQKFRITFNHEYKVTLQIDNVIIPPTCPALAPKRVRLSSKSTAARPRSNRIPEVDYFQIDLSGFSDETVAELRVRIQRIKNNVLSDPRRKFEEIVRGQKFRIKLNRFGKLTLQQAPEVISSPVRTPSPPHIPAPPRTPSPPPPPPFWSDDVL